MRGFGFADAREVDGNSLHLEELSICPAPSCSRRRVVKCVMMWICPLVPLHAKRCYKFKSVRAVLMPIQVCCIRCFFVDPHPRAHPLYTVHSLRDLDLPSLPILRRHTIPHPHPPPILLRHHLINPHVPKPELPPPPHRLHLPHEPLLKPPLILLTLFLPLPLQLIPLFLQCHPLRIPHPTQPVFRRLH